MVMLLIKATFDSKSMAYQIAPDVVRIEDGQDKQKQYCKILDCTHVDIKREKIAGQEYCVLSDTYGHEAGKIPSYLCESEDWVCFGDLLFGRVGDKGTEAGIQKDDIPVLTKHLYKNVQKLNVMQELKAQQEQAE